MMWFIHMYMQFGCWASELIIHVSDQPVDPSSGSTALDRLALGLEELTDHLPGRADRRCRRW